MLATLEVLAEVGYERLSTPLICERAGLSRGALTHHFPTKLELILSSYDHLLSIWEDRRKEFLAEKHSRPLTPEEYIRFLWNDIIRTDQYIAAIELAIAARGDDMLRSGMQDVLARWSEVRDGIWSKYFESRPDGIGSEIFRNLTTCFLRGLALQDTTSVHSLTNDEILSAWLILTRQNIQPAVSANDNPHSPQTGSISVKE